MVFKKFKGLPYLHKLAVTVVALFSLSVTLMIMFPIILKFQVKREMSLRNKTDMKEMWTTLPFPLELKVWVWNVTNALQAQKGEKPILKEVGPYVYERWMEKVNLKENKAEDSIEFNMKNTYRFKPELSLGHSEDDRVNSIQLLLVGTAVFTSKDKPQFLKVVAKGLKTLFNYTDHIFPPQRVGDLLFDGIKIDCTSTEFGAKALCSAYRGLSSLHEYEPNFFKYSLFGSANGTLPEKYKVLRGIKKISDVGRVIEFNQSASQNVWNGENCNRIRGTDATIFRPFLKHTDVLQSFVPNICRDISLVYEKKSKYKRIKAYRYTFDFGDLPNEPDNHCFCATPTTCPPKGIMDLFNCSKAIIYLSLPHFYKVDPAVQNKVLGLNPTKETHESIVDFEPTTGTPLFAKTRIQINTEIKKIPDVSYLQNTPDYLMPIVWFQETLALNKTFVNMIKFQLVYPSIAVQFIKWTSLLTALILGIYVYILNQDRSRTDRIFVRSGTRVKPLKDGRKENVKDLPPIQNTGIENSSFNALSNQAMRY